ncbi:hypothetical protein F7725_021563 [Dissostichus mawsoni]|uniref:Uncharacterized protein n=1 Tax=Dissostichus mawsoni TaxID=36200 RepID=A0A7J5ZBJ8_DISMA|nr:hypothetical protein F7725_021563 [Dissostichus mawsoni]
MDGGLGKTERGEQIRDIDLTSLRSTMPASGPLQKQPRAQKDLKGKEFGVASRLRTPSPALRVTSPKSLITLEVLGIWSLCICLSKQNEGVQKKAVIYGIVNKERKRERIKNDEEEVHTLI